MKLCAYARIVVGRPGIPFESGGPSYLAGSNGTHQGTRPACGKAAARLGSWYPYYSDASKITIDPAGVVCYLKTGYAFFSG